MPVFQNERTLPMVLTALFEQRLPPMWRARIVIADDGSTDATAAVVSRLQQQSPWPLTFLPGEHRGAGAARNRALQEIPMDDVVVLLGADIVVRPGALRHHLDFHEHHADVLVGGLGFIQWDPRLRPSTLMEWLVHGGPQNDFDAVLGEEWADPRHFFNGSFVSLKRVVLGDQAFDASFQEYGWEDLALGRRLAAQGFRLRCLPAARALHHHTYSPEAVERRQRAAGRSLVMYQRHYPTVALLPQRSWWHRWFVAGWRLTGCQALIRAVVGFSADRLSWPRLFHFFSVAAFWRGVYDRT